MRLPLQGLPSATNQLLVFQCPSQTHPRGDPKPCPICQGLACSRPEATSGPSPPSPVSSMQSAGLFIFTQLSTDSPKLTTCVTCIYRPAVNSIRQQEAGPLLPPGLAAPRHIHPAPGLGLGSGLRLGLQPQVKWLWEPQEECCWAPNLMVKLIMKSKT